MNALLGAALATVMLISLGSSGPAGSYVPGEGVDTTTDSLRAPRMERLSTFERSFRPADYDIDPDLPRRSDSLSPAFFLFRSRYAPSVPETLQGFRVQVVSTNDFDEATQTRNNLNIEIPDLWVYTVYDAPFYKIRVGDFLLRADANALVDLLTQRGYRGVWIVPDRVIKNPPPKPPPVVTPVDTSGALPE